MTSPRKSLIAALAEPWPSEWNPAIRRFFSGMTGLFPRIDEAEAHGRADIGTLFDEFLYTRPAWNLVGYSAMHEVPLHATQPDELAAELAVRAQDLAHALVGYDLAVFRELLRQLTRHDDAADDGTASPHPLDRWLELIGAALQYAIAHPGRHLGGLCDESEHPLAALGETVPRTVTLAEIVELWLQPDPDSAHLYVTSTSPRSMLREEPFAWLRLMQPDWGTGATGSLRLRLADRSIVEAPLADEQSGMLGLLGALEKSDVLAACFLAWWALAGRLVADEGPRNGINARILAALAELLTHGENPLEVLSNLVREITDDPGRAPVARGDELKEVLRALDEALGIGAAGDLQLPFVPAA